jgi:hypothetical protein
MKLRRIGKGISVFLLLGVFFYASSVKELHYAFSAKYHTEIHNDNCDHHIHSSDKEGDCFICKMDVVGILHFTETHYSFVLVFLPKTSISKPEEAPLLIQLHAYHLRGPPAIA